MRTARILALLLVGLLLGGAGCVLEEKVIELVVIGEACADFPENHASVSWKTARTIDYAAEIDDILADNDLSRSDIVMAKVKGATYTVTEFSHSHDWALSGAIEVTRTDDPEGPYVIVSYTNQSVQEALGVEVPAVLAEAGVELLNDALQDYIDGEAPVIIFEAVNDAVTPSPSAEDRIVFHWEACVQLHIVAAEEVKLPELF